MAERVNLKYQPSLIEKKWQKIWGKLNLYQAKDFSQKKKQYILVEFPFLSGEGLHVGHVRSYSALDAVVRKKRMDGYNVLYPIGWDAFGLPTENYAIKTGIHPIEITKRNIKLFKRQLKGLGLSFDWSREINTSDPKYYRWTQWIFLKLFEKGLAYQAKMPINWCPKCKIGLANEEVIAGRCERCGAETERRERKQWMLKITAYAERLLNDLEKVDYLEKIKAQQINWIGKSEGTMVKFKIQGKELENDEFIEVFTTRVDTIFGVTALVLAPEHELVNKITTEEQRMEVANYIKASKKKSEFERTSLEKEKTGVFTGFYAFNPINNEKIPIWVGDYVIPSYGGGAVMVVPAHDKRDYQFAQKYGLEIREVVKGGDISKEVFVDYGVLVNSGQFNGLKSERAIEKITQWLEKNRLGRRAVNYKLRDWIFSRQHYWGEPIPLVFCQNCAVKIKNKKEKIKNSKFNKGELLNPGWIAVPEKDLPVKLPYVKKYQPTDTGESPLAVIKKWINTKCPKCGGPAKRETDTMPNWAGSNWYYLAYIMRGNSKFEIRNSKLYEYWLPIDLYNGGMEHTTLHLLYSRFWHKFLYDIGIVPTDEPYLKRRSHGMVLAADSRKMSKSLGNVVNPDEVIKQYGADSVRLYEMFMGPYDEAINWSTEGLEGCHRFLKRVWALFNNKQKISSKTSQELVQKLHYTIKKVGDDLENMKFNTAISSMMEFVNLWQGGKNILSKRDAENFLKILAPFAPHIAEELYQIGSSRRGGPGNLRKFVFKSIFQEKWPKYDPALIKEKEIVLVVQINGRLRDKVKIEADLPREEVEKIILEREKIKKYLTNQKIRKIIFIPNKLINLVI